jgi:hypothetical protein
MVAENCTDAPTGMVAVSGVTLTPSSLAKTHQGSPVVVEQATAAEASRNSRIPHLGLFGFS